MHFRGYDSPYSQHTQTNGSHAPHSACSHSWLNLGLNVLQFSRKMKQDNMCSVSFGIQSININIFFLSKIHLRTICIAFLSTPLILSFSVLQTARSGSVLFPFFPALFQSAHSLNLLSQIHLPSRLQLEMMVAFTLEASNCKAQSERTPGL